MVNQLNYELFQKNHKGDWDYIKSKDTALGIQCLLLDMQREYPETEFAVVKTTIETLDIKDVENW